MEAKASGGAIKVLIFPDAKVSASSSSLKPQYLAEPYGTRVVTTSPEPPQTICISGNHIYLRTALEVL
jgi:hypothetical protein